jgi:hypothetical protein
VVRDPENFAQRWAIKSWVGSVIKKSTGEPGETGDIYLGA